MQIEEIKEFPLQEFKYRYSVSSLGQIISKRTKTYLTKKISNNFNVVSINDIGNRSAKQFRVDNLIASAFLEKDENKDFVQHIDKDNLNDNVNNLRWINTCDYLSDIYGNIWKEIIFEDDGYGKYYISNIGDVWSLCTNKIFSPQVISGYKSVTIGYPKKFFQSIHRLVATAFCDKPDNAIVVNHKDGNKMNNNADNLEWVTVSENVLHALTLKERKTPTINEKTDPPQNYIQLDWLQDYYITNDGQVYSVKSGKYLTLHLNDCGYYRVYCVNNKKQIFLYVHRLVAEAYLPKPSLEQTQVNHKNLNRLDNNVENLEWVTSSENILHASENNPHQKRRQKRIAQIDKDTDEIICIHEGIKHAGRITGINSGSIVAVCKNRKLLAGGFKWKYDE